MDGFPKAEGKFFMPPSLSAEAQDLLKCMLSVDPLKRIKLHEIRMHSWVIIYTHPRDLVIEKLTIDLLERMNEINEGILEIILKFKFNFGALSLEGIVQAIKENRSEDFVVAYNLLKSERYKQLLDELLFKSTISITLKPSVTVSCFY